MSKLFSSFSIRNLMVKNRIMMAPMCMFSADQNGYPSDWHLSHYVTRAVGGCGLIILEATGVESRGRISDRDLGLWHDEQIEGLRAIALACQKHGAKVGLQLGHAGRKSNVLAEECIAPSAVAFNSTSRVPKEMSVEDIVNVENAFQEAAKRADLAGFDTIELHAAHGYLINQFLSPLTNRRTDEYGGCEENRARFLKEILQKVRDVWPAAKPIIVRVSAEDYAEGGNHAEDLARMLNFSGQNSIDLIDVSSGGAVDVRPQAYPGYQIRFAETIKAMTGISVVAGGLITSPLMAEEILQNERADLVFLGRELLRNPYWPLLSATSLEEEHDWPVQYKAAF